MKYLLQISVFVFLLSCRSETANKQSENLEQNSKSTAFITNPELVDKLFILDKNEQNKYSFKEVETHTLDLNNDGKTDRISLLMIENWGDPGDFLKINVDVSGAKPFEFSNYSGWVTFNENYSISEEVAAKNLIDSKNILLLNATPSSKLILLFGWAYASQAGLVTIIDPNNGAILFNKNWDLQKITDSNSDDFLELHGKSIFDGTTEILDFGNRNIQLTNLK